MVKEPHHFTHKDMIRAFFGSFIVAITFLFKGSMVQFAIHMNISNTISVAILTCVLLTLEIYILSYKYVKEKRKRPFLEFWAKRFFSILFTSFISIYILMFVYGIDTLVSTNIELFKICMAIMLPSTVAGGAMEIIRKQ